ncbi:FAS1 domain-containing protein [Tricharina praecox]|uniref:FAS1 domain-containing protein n=1 Tax=Tricharina praecox TaxID=43433 RepID=UPI00221F0F24|nr:FAS1 domain-containing protein [Tricharina praecox]KAI5846654.1 FAS1 domain-containing protein [Tricharina praecox]
MKITSLFVSAACFSLPLVYGQPLIDVLVTRGFTEYAANLQAYPALLARLQDRNDITVWAVPNKYVTSPDSATSSPRLVRRQSEVEVSASISHDGKPPTSGISKRQAGGNAASNFMTLRTFLEDPTFVNLGPGQPGRYVRSYTDSPPGSDQANIQITTGLGTVITQFSGPFKYDKGLIYGVTNFPTLPRPLPETLQTLGLDTFHAAITAAGREDKLDNTPGVTIFAPANSSLHGDDTIDVDAHTISDGFFFLPELFDQSPHRSDAGTTLTMTFSEGSFYVNGVRIIKSDISIKNGVVHVIEKPLDYCGEGKDDKKKVEYKAPAAPTPVKEKEHKPEPTKHHYKPRGAVRI